MRQNEKKIKIYANESAYILLSRLECDVFIFDFKMKMIKNEMSEDVFQ